MRLKVISHWVLVIAIASFMGTCLIKASEAKRRLSFFQDYPPTKYFSDAHDKYIVEKQGSIYPIRSNNTTRKTKRKRVPAKPIPVDPPSTCHVLLYIIRSSLLLFALEQIQETYVGISYLWLHFMDLLKFLNPLTAMNNIKNFGVCVFLQFAIKRMFLSKFVTLLLLFCIEPNDMFDQNFKKKKVNRLTLGRYVWLL